MLVVLVEDNEILNHHLSSQLGDLGHTVYAEKTASACLQTIQKQPNTDVMIIDLGLPDFDGFTLINQINAKWAGTSHEARLVWLSCIVISMLNNT